MIMVNLLFNGHDFKFLTPFIDFCRENPALSVQVDKHRGHVVDSDELAEEYCEWADIVFCEWALGNAVWYSRHKRSDQLLIVRLHSQEIEKCRHFLDQIVWEQVDRLILICPRNRNRMETFYPELKGKIELVFNPIDAGGRFSLPRMEGADFNLGFVGIVPQLKRLDLAFEIFEELKRHDSRYTLSIKGAKPQEYPWMAERTEEMRYYNRLFERIETSPYRNSVIFEPHNPQMAEWYSHIGFLLSTSDFEGSHQAVAEGMAAGCIPVIRNWAGAPELYPPRYVYDYEGGAEQACQLIRQWKESPETYLSELEFCRDFAVRNFDQQKVCRELEALLALHPAYIPAKLASASESPLHVMLIGYIPPGARDGYRIRIEQLIKHLRQHNVTVTLGCLHPVADADKLAAHAQSLAQEGCKVRMVECANFFDMSLDQRSAEASLCELERIIEEENIGLIQAEALYAARYGAMLKERNPELPFVFDCHGASPEEEAMSNASPARIRTSEAWEAVIMTAADLSIFVAAAMREHFRQKYGEVREHRVVPCCIQETACRSLDCCRPELGLPSDRPVIGYVGTLAAWQCTPEMFTLFRELARRDSRLFFAMITPQRDHETCLRYFREAGISRENFKVMELPHSEVAGALSYFSCGMLLRRDSAVNRVSSPTKFGEYAAAGVPVVLTDCVGDYSSLAQQYRLGIVLKSRPDECWNYTEQELDAILKLTYERFANEEEFIRRGVGFVRENILWDKHVAELVAAYRKLSCEK